MGDIIYLIVHGAYSDWDIIGYFTTLEEAEKYVVNYNKDLEGDYGNAYILNVAPLDNTCDLSGVLVRYEYSVMFIWSEDTKSWVLKPEQNEDPDIYTGKYPRSNYADSGIWYYGKWVRIYINTTKRDFNFATKIAEDLFAILCYECDGAGNISDQSIEKFNTMLSADETARKEKEKQEALREKELAELKRLKEKYEND